MTDLVGPIVALDNVRLTLTSRAGAVEILRGVSLNVAPGRSLAIVGPSGSGKTSLLMVMAGLERATSGKVHIVGQDLTKLSQDELALLRGAKIGIVFQAFHLVPTMTAIENIALPLELQSDPKALDVARKLLGEVGLSSRADHFPAELSGGEQQRIALARALSTRPSLILADEPTGNLDANTGQQVIDILFELQKAHGATLIMITHDVELASRCQSVAHMSDGRIVSDAKIAAVEAAK